MEQIITEFISRFGYAAIFILILLENVLLDIIEKEDQA